MSEKIAIEVDPKDALVRHIESLQRALTKRNARIAELEARLEGEGEAEHMQRARREGYREGYQTAAGRIMDATRKFKDVLDNANHEAFQVYLEGDRIGWEKAE